MASCLFATIDKLVFAAYIWLESWFWKIRTQVVVVRKEMKVLCRSLSAVLVLCCKNTGVITNSYETPSFENCSYLWSFLVLLLLLEVLFIRSASIFYIKPKGRWKLVCSSQFVHRREDDPSILRALPSGVILLHLEIAYERSLRRLPLLRASWSHLCI